jgi:hypothetical protein
MKPRKPTSGAVAQKIERVGAIQRQIRRERERHHNKTASLSAQRAAVARVADPALRAAKLTKLRHDEIEEGQRHKAKLDELQRRAREVWR